MSRIRYPLSLAIAVSLAMVPAKQLLAQEASPTSRSVDEIVVTARKREETVQEIPLSVSAISAEAIERAGIDNLADIADFTAGLIYQDFGGGGLGAPVIRGQAQTDIRSVEANVGVFLDGVFITSRGNLDFGLIDMERVEVVKGPQSALYGNNTFGGAINYVTRRPTEELGGKVSATYGNAGRREISGALSGSLVQGLLTGRVSGGYGEFDGTVDNSIGGNLGGYSKKYAVSAQLDFTPTETFDARAYFYYGQTNMDPTAGFVYTNNCGGLNSAANPAVTTGRGGSGFRYYCGNLFAPDQVTVREQFTFGNQSSSLLSYLSLGLDITDKLRVTSLTSVGNYKSDALVDFFYNSTQPIPPTLRQLIKPDFGGSKDWSQELRLESSGNDRLDWTVGAYLNSFEVDRAFIFGFPAGFFPDAFPPGSPATIISNSLTLTDSDLWAVFAGTDYVVTDRLNLRLEGRYTSDKRKVRLINVNTGAETPRDDTFSDTTYRASLDFALTDDVMVYGSVAEGTKTGGFNNTPLPEEQTFGPEANLVFEVGIKSLLLDGRMLLNAALFYSRWSDAQITTPSQVPGNTNVTRNVGNVTTPGGEVDLTWSATDNLFLTAGYAYSDPTFDSGTIDIQHDRRCATPADCGLTAGPGGIGIDVSGQRVDRSVRHTGYLSATYEWMVNSVEYFVRSDMAYTGDQPQRSLNLQFMPTRTLFNARAGIILPNGFEAAIWARNLFDKQYVYSGINQPEPPINSSFSTGHVANGRTFGVTTSYRF